MKLAAAALFAVLCIAVAQPPKPNLPEVFEGRIFVEVRISHNGDNTTLRSEGWWAIDEPQGKGIEDYRFEGTNGEHDVVLLQRFDLGAIYDVQSIDECTRHAVNGTMPAVWGWLSQASFKGEEKFGPESVNVWSAQIGYAEMIVGVDARDNTRPVFVVRKGEQREVVIWFRYFVARTPNQGLFMVPHHCPQNATIARPALNELSAAKCVSRSDMIARAQKWVDAHVPYNQGGYYGGYREDCSGFVSMAWELSSSLTTQTLPTVSHPISKDDLQPGDVLLDRAEHVVLFGGWTSGAKTQYTAYEETRPGEGTVKRATPYPYWYNQAAFLPYRFNSVC